MKHRPSSRRKTSQRKLVVPLAVVPGAIVPQVCQLLSLHLGSTAQVSLLGLPVGCLALRALQCESRVPLSSPYAISQADKADMVVAEAEKHSFPSHTWWTASLCHWVQHCSSNHLKASRQLMCPLLSQQQQGRTPAVQTTRRLSLSLLPPAAPGRSPPAQAIKASGALVPAWPRQARLMVPVAFPGRQPDGSNAEGKIIKQHLLEN